MSKHGLMGVCQHPSMANCGSGLLPVCMSCMMSEIYTIMRCITMPMQGITHLVQRLLMHISAFVHKEFSTAFFSAFFPSGPRDLAKL